MTGIVSSNKMTKAIVVTVFSTKVHTKYNKRFKTKKRYTVACEDASLFILGQPIEIIETRPLSKTIRFKVAIKE
jgi:ribosomal protein S17